MTTTIPTTQDSSTAYSQPPTIVLLHGAGVSHTWWTPQIESLKNEFPILAPDLPEHGTRVHQKFTLDAAVNLVAKVIDSKASGPVIITGISLGGYVAMAHAERHPDQSIGLVLAGSSLNLVGINGLSFKASGLFLRFKGAEWVEEKSTPSMRKRLTPEQFDQVKAGGFYYASAINVFSRIAGKNYARMLRNYPHPVLFVNGEGDEPNRKGEAKMLAAIPNAQLEIIQEADHFSNMQQPGAFNQVIRAFAANVYQPG